MFRPFRLIMLATLVFGVYVGFFQVPMDRGGVADFDPAVVTKHEIEAWQASKAREEVGTFIAHTLHQRELHRYTWFRAAQTGLDMTRMSGRFVFVDFRGRYDRVLPYLESVATVERDWKKLSFDPSVVAQTQLNWMVTARMWDANDSGSIASQMAEEYAMRYGLRPDQMFDAASRRAEAFKLMILSTVDPDWPAIASLLEESYRTLQATLRDARRTR